MSGLGPIGRRNTEFLVVEEGHQAVAYLVSTEIDGRWIEIDIAGLFVVSDGTRRFYTRAGNFQLDADGRLFPVTSAEPIAGQGWMILDMGTSDRRLYVEVGAPSRPAWPEIEALVLEQVRSPQSTLAGNERAVQRVHELHDVKTLIEAAREFWNWGS